MLDLEHISLRDYVAHSVEVAPELTLEEAYQRAHRENVEYMAVVEGNQLLGMCSARAINAVLSVRFGHAIFARKQVRDFLLKNAFTVREDARIKSVLESLFARERESFYEDLILVDCENRLLGLIPMESMIRLQHQVLLGQLEVAEKHRSELSQKNASLSILADDLERANRDLTVARNAAEQATRLKSAFLANMSHEIRTPMNGVIGMLSLVKETELDADQADLVDTAASSAETLLRIINDILDLSKIEAEKVDLETSPFCPAELIESCVMLYRERARAKGITLNLMPTALPPALLGDAVRIRQILTNLISNAVKFTDSGGIEVAAESTPSGTSAFELEVRVSDTGIGISADELKQLFRPFVQADSSDSRRYEGTGLGLSISRSLAHLMGGEIDCRSRKGEGSCFVLRLPMPVPVADAEEPAGAAGALSDDSAYRGSACCEESEAAGDERRTAVLVVEDNRVNQKVAGRFLSKLDCEVTFANNGSEALARFREEKFDLIFMDCQMPIMDGFETTRRIRAGACGTDRSTVYISAMTANAMRGDRQKCLAAGMDDYVAKPLRRDDFKEILERCRAATSYPAWEARS